MPKKKQKPATKKKAVVKTVKRLPRRKIPQEHIDTLIRKGTERGFLTTSEILNSITDIERHIEELELMYDQLRERGVELREAREFLETTKDKEKEKKQKKVIVGKIDPIQMYLKEIGRTGFLSA